MDTVFIFMPATIQNLFISMFQKEVDMLRFCPTRRSLITFTTSKIKTNEKYFWLRKKTVNSLKENGMNTFINKFDPLEQLIIEKGLRIAGIHFYPVLDLMLVVLNNKKILKRSISSSARLKNATSEQLFRFELLGDGVAVHWPDEDLSLKGFLQEELASADMPLVA
jgi:hypothetical protein